MKKIFTFIAVIACTLSMSAQSAETKKFFGDSHITGTIMGGQVNQTNVLDVVTLKDNMKTIVIPEIQYEGSTLTIPSFEVSNLSFVATADGYQCQNTEYSVTSGDGKTTKGKLSAHYFTAEEKLSVSLTIAYGNMPGELTYEQEGNYSTYVEIGGEAYRTVVLKDGREWMVDNLRYIPEGMTVTALADDYTGAASSGIYYPATFSIESGAAVVTPSMSRNDIRRMGLLYTEAVVMNGTLPTDDFVDADNTQGIAPEGWHVPTAQEWIDLVGACSLTAKNNTAAPYYDSSLSGASLEALNEDGFNFLPYPYVNQGKKYLGSYLNKREGSIYNTYASMAYFASSTGRSATQSYAGMITNNNTKSSVNCAYNNLTNGIFVRFIKDKTTTGISNVNNSTTGTMNNTCYNLSGQRVSADAKGIVIINGKKYLRN